MEIFVRHQERLINTRRIVEVGVGEHEEAELAGKFFVSATIDSEAVRLSEGILTKKGADQVVTRFGSALDRKASAGGGTIDWDQVEKPRAAKLIR